MPLYRSYSVNKCTWNKKYKNTHITNKSWLAIQMPLNVVYNKFVKYEKKKFICVHKSAHELNRKMCFSSRIGKSLLGFQPAITMQAPRVHRNATDGSLKYSITQETWRRYDKETLSALLVLCEGNPAITCRFHLITGHAVVQTIAFFVFWPI